MLNEEKIRLMADIAVFEKKNGSRMKAITSYFKSDYISRNMIRGFLSFTLCSILILVLWMLYNMELLISTISLDAVVAMIRKASAFYLIGLVLYLAFVYTVFARRYDDEARKNRIYTAKLKHLDKRYEYQSRSRELAKEGRRV